MMEQELLKPFVASEFCDTDSMKPTYWRTDLLITRPLQPCILQGRKLFPFVVW